MAGPLLPVLLSTALSGVGMLLQNNAADDAAKKQQNIINQADEATKRKNQQKNKILQDFTQDTFNPMKRNQNYENSATKAETGLLDSLKSNNAGEVTGDVNSDVAGKLSSDYVTGRAKSTIGAADDIMARARLAARGGAGADMFSGEAMQGNQIQSDLSAIDSSINRINRGAQTDVNGVRSNGSLIGGLLTGGAGAAGSLAGDWFKSQKPSVMAGNLRTFA